MKKFVIVTIAIVATVVAFIVVGMPMCERLVNRITSLVVAEKVAGKVGDVAGKMTGAIGGLGSGAKDVGAAPFKAVGDMFGQNKSAQSAVATSIAVGGKKTGMHSSMGRKAPLADEVEVTVAGQERTLNREFGRLRSYTEEGEFRLQRVLSLLDTEIDLVQLLLAGEHGYLLERTADIRDTMLDNSAPSVVWMYDRVMNVATTQAQLLPKIRGYAADGGSLHRALPYHERRMFLGHMAHVLKYYYSTVGELHHKLVLSRK